MAKTLEEYREALQETAQPEPESAEAVANSPPQAPETEPPGTAKPDPEEAKGPPARDDENPPEPKGIKETLADAGVDIKAVYDSKIPGTDITFGEAKDAAPDIADVTRLKLETEKRSDELASQQETGYQQLQLTMQRLADKFGAAEVRSAYDMSEQDLATQKEANKVMLQRYRPELADPALYSQALDQMGEIGRFYQLSRSQAEVLPSNLQRMALRLYKLESYLDTLRKPEPTAKQVRGSAKKGAKSSGSNRRKFSSEGAQKYHDRLVNRS